ncbi:MAG TPA: acyl carrier protein [Steroidobacteraceae bacterium]|nr:acyl carrier protein [Steroidobacteraceae bacterium]
MHSEQEIYGQVRRVLAELFELPPEKIVPAANLYTDLDIDSLDAIDLILELKQITGRKIQPEQFRHVRTVGDVVTAVRELMQDETAA